MSTRGKVVVSIRIPFKRCEGDVHGSCKQKQLQGYLCHAYVREASLIVWVMSVMSSMTSRRKQAAKQRLTLMRKKKSRCGYDGPFPSSTACGSVRRRDWSARAP